METPDFNISDEKRSHTEIAAALIEIIQAFSEQLRGGKGSKTPVSLDSRLRDELGIDSISRTELIRKIERELAASLPDHIAITAETPRELMEALDFREGKKMNGRVAVENVKREALVIPQHADSLVDVLEWHAERHSDTTHLLVAEEDGKTRAISYGELSAAAHRVAAGLRERRLDPGDTVALMFPTSAEFFFSFFGILLAGGIPVPIYPPSRIDQLEEHLRRQIGILENSRVRFLLTVSEARPISRLLKASLPAVDAVLTLNDLDMASGLSARLKARPEAIALLQYTSGSTGHPKGVILKHQNLLANIRVIGEGIAARSSDVFVSWLPLYHDMGLIGAWLGSLYYGVKLVVMSPLSFIARPESWLRAISDHRGTLSASPNFGYEICASKLTDEALDGIDLSSWRIAFNGAEAVLPSTLERFASRFKRYGLSDTALFPVYGLAECALGLTFPPLGRPVRVDCVDRRALQDLGQARSASAGDEHAARFAGCGAPLPGHEIRVVDLMGRELPDREEGRIEFRGPSATPGYFRNTEATELLIRGGWWQSGDLGYIAAGDLFITGREKDLIIRGGRNIHPAELEAEISVLAGVRKGGVAAFGACDTVHGTEQLVIAAETAERDPDAQVEIERQIRKAVAELVGEPPDEVILLAPRSIPKTSSGKLRRAACRAAFAEGTLGRSGSIWIQIFRIGWQSTWPSTRRAARVAQELLYTLYCYVLFFLLTFVAAIAVLLIPNLSVRRSFARRAAQAFFLLSRIEISIDGLAHLETNSPQVVVVNHSSYIDSVLLTAVLPTNFSFVAKQELSQNAIIRWLLSRLQVHFVERFSAEQGIADAKRLVEAVQRGESLVFYPEGTFFRAAGLLRFRMGAFTVAAQGNASVVPVAIVGTRLTLRAEQWAFRRIPLKVAIMPPIASCAPDWDEAVRLKNEARAAILRVCGEPDLD